MRLLARARAREAPRHIVRSTSVAWERRWTGMLPMVCAVVCAASLVDPVAQCESMCHTGGCLRSSVTSWRRILVRSCARHHSSTD